MGKFAKSVLAAVGVVVLFFVIYLFIYRDHVSAPSDLGMESQIEFTKSPQQADFTGNEDALKNALNLYIQKKQEGLDMSKGPCLGKIADDWVLDIAHNPRLSIDDEPENQCKDYVEGKVNHFIELDPDGNLIRSQ